MIFLKYCKVVAGLTDTFLEPDNICEQCLLAEQSRSINATGRSFLISWLYLCRGEDVDVVHDL